MLKLDLAAAQTRITELETAAATHATAITERDTKISGLETKVTELTTAAESHASAIEAKDAKITELTASVETHVATIASKETEITTLKASATTIDAAADVKAREIAARAGVTLPAKAPEAGNTETDDAKAAAGTPTEKLAQIFEPKA